MDPATRRPRQDRGGWFWRRSDRLEFSDSIPPDVFDANREAMCRLHESPEAATAALADALRAARDANTHG